MTGSIRTACIGTGYFSRFHLDAWRRLSQIELVGCASLNCDEARSTGLAAFGNVEEMLAQTWPDLIDIITPPSTHLDMIRLCIDGGVSTIICQKPFCETIDQAKEAIAMCEATGTELVIHENFRFQPWYRCMKNAIAEGVLGDVHQLSFRLRTGDGQGPQAYLERQPYFQKMEKFLIRETGVHWIDTFRYLLGEPTSIYADLRKMNPAIAGEDAGYFLMEFPGNKRALFDANRHLDHSAENCRTTFGEALLEGTEGTITLSGSGELQLRKFGSCEVETLLPAQDWPGFAGDCVFALQSHIVAGISKGGAIENRARDYMKVIELEAAIYQSAEMGTKVEV